MKVYSLFRTRCVFLHIFLCAISLFAISSAYAKDSNVPDERVNKCRTDLRVCQHLNTRISVDIKAKGWDVEQNKFPLDVLTKIRDNYFDSADCQYEYQACLIGQSADLDEFRKKINTTPETELELSTPTEEDVDPEAIKQVVQFAESIEGLRSLLIVKNGKLISESYYQFKDDPRPQWIMSATKSVVSLLIGIAIDKGYISSENVSIKPYFKNYFSSTNQPDKEKIRIIDLLRMKSGLDFSDETHWHNSNPEIADYWISDYWFADNANDYALKFDMAYKPGEMYQYSSPAIDLLTAILNQSTGMTVAEFAEENLFNPLGIKNYLWAHDSKEYYRGSYVLFLRPRDLAKIGQLILNNGVYNSKQLISSSWLKKSFTVHQTEDVWEGTLPTTGMKLGYGYLWYVSKLNDHIIHFAWGYGGQLIIIVPEKNLLVTTTANPDVALETSGIPPDMIFDGVVNVLLGGSSKYIARLSQMTKASDEGCNVESYPDPKTSEYILPYEVGKTFQVGQGNCGEYTHQPRCTIDTAAGETFNCGDLRYAYDFNIPIGSNILAARGGTIVGAVDKFSNTENEFMQANFVTILHNDGTVAVYNNLSIRGVLVEIGDKVSQGDVIGIAGSSGYNSKPIPQLHFHVIEPPFIKCSPVVRSGCKTTPITFRNAKPLDSSLKEDSSYKALPFN